MIPFTSLSKFASMMFGSNASLCTLIRLNRTPVSLQDLAVHSAYLFAAGSSLARNPTNVGWILRVEIVFFIWFLREHVGSQDYFHHTY